MKRLRMIHIVSSVVGILLVSAGFALLSPDSAGEYISLISAAVCAALQLVFIQRGDNRSRFFKVRISAVGMIYLLLQLVLSVFGLLAEISPVIAAAAGILLFAAAVVGALAERPPSDPDPTGTLFLSQLTDMMDTISRATAERDCGIHTQMLYEQARFGEPCTDPAIRPLERRILEDICGMKPTDSDDEIAEKCREIMSLLEEREKKMKKTDLC
ncbi:MAG: hypothetical protein IJO91_00965 [Oscillospiraceae bacterium]|nr:hypothetical protein [Oscillospiraceae bacterium]